VRVQLPASSSPPSSPTPAPNPIATGPAPSAAPAKSQAGLGERLLNHAAQWNIALPVALGCAVVAGWSLFFRLADSRELLKVHARAPQPAQTNRLFTADELSGLRREVEARSARLIRDRKEIPALLSELDATARKLGWRCEAALKPAVSAPGGVRNLTAHRVVADLRYDYVQPERAYAGLVSWLWSVSTLPARAEIAAVKLQSLGNGLNSAQVELIFYSLNPHAETAPK
jgi:hypothetical protein